MTGMNSASMTGLLLGGVSVVPAIALIRDMDRRGKIVNAAFLVSAASALAAHLGFTFGIQKEMVVPLLAVKFVGGIRGGVTAYLLTEKLDVPMDLFCDKENAESSRATMAGNNTASLSLQDFMKDS